MNIKCFISLFFSIIMLICLVFNAKMIFSKIESKDSTGIGFQIFAAIVCAIALAINLTSVITSFIIN